MLFDDSTHRASSAGKALVLLIACIAWTGSARAGTLTLSQTIPLPGVEGRIDHLSIDAAGRRLFVAALGNDTIEVVDLKAGKVSRSLDGFSEPQGLCYASAFNRLYVANGGDGTLRILDGTSFAAISTVRLGDDADNVRYDPATKQVYVGYGSGALGIVDAKNNRLVATIPLTGHPESFQLEPDGPLIFVNVPHSLAVAVVDRAAKKAIGTWSLGLAAANFPMALDSHDQRAFIGCRLPGRLLVFDTKSGRETAKLDLDGDCDDIFYDATRRRLYASCGAGFIDVYAQADADHYTLLERLETARGARTSFFDGDMLYLATPRRDTSAAIRCYRIQP